MTPAPAAQSSSPDGGAPASAQVPGESPNGVHPRDQQAELERRAAGGLRWLMVQSLAYKAVSFFGQIGLTHLVSPRDTGLVTLALGVAVFTNFLQQQGLREVLVRLRARHQRWDGIAFWLSVALGLVGLALTVIAAPIAARAFHAPEVRNLMLILALAPPMNAICNVAEAKLQSELAFKALAAIEFVRGVGTLGLTIILAGLGWGAYAFIVPFPLFIAFRLAALWFMARPRVSLRPCVKRWKFLFGDSVLLTVASVVGQLVPAASIFVLGRFHDEAQVGLYAFANNLSLTTAVLITNNIGQVMFPVFTRFQNDPVALRQSFLRSGRLLNVLAVPICVMQGVLAGPFIGLACGQRYQGSIEMLQALSLAMSLVILSPSARALMQAQGRFRMCLFLALVNTAIYSLAAFIGAMVGGGLAVSIAVIIAFTISGIIDPWCAIAPVGGRLRDVVSMSLVPITVSLLGIVVPFLVISRTAYFSQHLLAQGVVVTLASGVGCLVLYRLLAPRDLADILGFVVGIVNRRILRRGA